MFHMNANQSSGSGSVSEFLYTLLLLHDWLIKGVQVFLIKWTVYRDISFIKLKYKTNHTSNKQTLDTKDALVESRGGTVEGSCSDGLEG